MLPRVAPRLWTRLIACALALTACRGGDDAQSGGEPPDAAASPQAKAEPAPLANVPAVASANAGRDAGVPIPSLRADREVGPDVVPRDPPREIVVRVLDAGRDAGRDAAREIVLRESKDLSGYTLHAVLRPTDLPPAYRGPEVSAGGMDTARRRTEPRLTIDLSQSRARMVIAGGGFVLPKDTELRARLDRYGHVLLWPGESTYRVVAPGALRALFGERRLDVAPFSGADVVPAGEGARRLNQRTRRVEVTTRAGKGAFEIASVKDAGEGGVLLCRMLLDLMSAPPSTPLCQADDIPLHVDLRWTSLPGGNPAPGAPGHGDGFVFDVTSMTRRTDIPPQQMAAPPSNVTFVRTPPPLPPNEALLTRAELAALRSVPIEVPSPSYGDAQPPPPEMGLELVNGTDQLRVVWLDGFPVAWVAPGARASLSALTHGRYILQWRTYFGEALEPELVVVPGRSEIVLNDAGAPMNAPSPTGLQLR